MGVGRQLGDTERMRLLAAALPERVFATDVNRSSPTAGSAKFTRPSPPKVVPRRENNAWFWLIGNSCPLQSAHPFGAKSKLMIRTSDKNGSAIRVPLIHAEPTAHQPDLRQERFCHTHLPFFLFLPLMEGC
jgi:hypothetical protein